MQAWYKTSFLRMGSSFWQYCYKKGTENQLNFLPNIDILINNRYYITNAKLIENKKRFCNVWKTKNVQGLRSQQKNKGMFFTGKSKEIFWYVSCSRHRTTKFPNSESPIFFLLAWSNSRARHSAIYTLKSRNLF